MIPLGYYLHLQGDLKRFISIMAQLVQADFSTTRLFLHLPNSIPLWVRHHDSLGK